MDDICEEPGSGPSGAGDVEVLNAGSIALEVVCKAASELLISAISSLNRLNSMCPCMLRLKNARRNTSLSAFRENTPVIEETYKEPFQIFDLLDPNGAYVGPSNTTQWFTLAKHKDLIIA